MGISDYSTDAVTIDEIVQADRVIAGSIETVGEQSHIATVLLGIRVATHLLIVPGQKR